MTSVEGNLLLNVLKELNEGIEELKEKVEELDERTALLGKKVLQQELSGSMTNTMLKELENDISEIKFRLDDGLYDDEDAFEERAVKRKKVAEGLFQNEENEFVNGEGKPVWMRVEHCKYDRDRGQGFTYVCSHCYAEFNEPHSTCPKCASEMDDYYVAKEGDGEND